MAIFIVWVVGFVAYAALMIHKMSGRNIGFDTTSNMHLAAIVALSLLWPIHIPIVVYRKLRSA